MSRIFVLLLFGFYSFASFAASFPVGGLRPATLHTPETYKPGTSYPLLIFLHGYTGTSAGYERYLDVTQQLRSLGVISIVPDGTKNSRGEQFWNATPECCDFEKSGVDDVAYIKQLIEEASTRFSVDRKRVYLMGHSNGGFMAYRMACEADGLIQGLVSIAGATFKTPEQCLRPTPLKVLQIHGEKDDVVPYGENPNFPSPAFSVEYWKTQMDCKTQTTESLAFDLLKETPSESRSRDTDQILWSDCEGGHKVGLWTIRQGSHSPPFLPSQLFSKVLEFLY